MYLNADLEAKVDAIVEKLSKEGWPWDPKPTRQEAIRVAIEHYVKTKGG